MTVLGQENTSSKDQKKKKKGLEAATSLAGIVRGASGNAEFLGI